MCSHVDSKHCRLRRLEVLCVECSFCNMEATLCLLKVGEGFGSWKSDYVEVPSLIYFQKYSVELVLEVEKSFDRRSECCTVEHWQGSRTDKFVRAQPVSRTLAALPLITEIA